MQDGQVNLAADFVGRRKMIAFNPFSPLPSVASPARAGSSVWAQGARLAAVAGLIGLAGCSGPTTRAPIVEGVDAARATTTGSPTAATYVVRPGDTLYAIARTTNTDFDTIKRLNNLSDPNQLTVGQVLRLTATARASGPTGGASATGSPVSTIRSGPAASSQPRPLDEPAKPAASAATPAAPATSATPTPAPAPDAGAINWAWPATGSIIQTFTTNTKGIDIAGSPGDPIKAAADGKVMYIGNGVRGLGNLVIVNHDNGFITVYGHNRTLLVKTGQQVKRGDRIAELGQTDTTSPRLHFEVRRRGTPVDPLRYLPPQ